MRKSAPPYANRVVTGLAVQLGVQGLEALGGQTLVSAVPGYEPKSALTITTAEAVRDNCHPYPADRVVMAVDVVTSDRDGEYVKRRTLYAMSGIPLCLLVDPNDGVIELHTEQQSYCAVDFCQFGESVTLPEPLSFVAGHDSVQAVPAQAAVGPEPSGTTSMSCQRLDVPARFIQSGRGRCRCRRRTIPCRAL